MEPITTAITSEGFARSSAKGPRSLTTRANQKVVETMASARQAGRLASKPRKPQFEFLETSGKRVFSDGDQTVELIDIGPLFFVPNNDAPFDPVAGENSIRAW